MIQELSLYRFGCSQCQQVIDQILQRESELDNLPQGWGWKDFAEVVHRTTDTPYRTSRRKLCCDECMAHTFETEWEYVEQHGWPEFEKHYCAYVDSHADRFSDPEGMKRIMCKSKQLPQPSMRSKLYVMDEAAMIGIPVQSVSFNLVQEKEG